MTKTALYRHYDATGTLLYVGITGDLQARDKRHGARSAWHSEVARTETEWLTCRRHARALEAVAIEFEHPKYNIQLARPDVSDEPVRRERPALVRDGEDHIAHIWPTMADLAADLGKPYTTVAAWKQRGSIPAKYDTQLVTAAQARGETLTYEQLAQARAEVPPTAA